MAGKGCAVHHWVYDGRLVMKINPSSISEDEEYANGRKNEFQEILQVSRNIYVVIQNSPIGELFESRPNNNDQRSYLLEELMDAV
ncbi:hypothetical protein Tco_0740732 [Tanacetum coccineum]